MRRLQTQPRFRFSSSCPFELGAAGFNSHFGGLLLFRASPGRNSGQQSGLRDLRWSSCSCRSSCFSRHWLGQSSIARCTQAIRPSDLLNVGRESRPAYENNKPIPYDISFESEGDGHQPEAGPIVLGGVSHPRRSIILTEIANAAVFAVSGQGRGMTGAVVNLSGGTIADYSLNSMVSAIC